MTTSAPLPPAAALRRIAFLLERAQEPTYKVRAFRRAAGAVEAVEPAELDRIVAAGGAGLRALPGVGEVTERVIREALAGEVPVYLRRLEAIEGRPVAEGAAALRAALRGDLHVHAGRPRRGGVAPSRAARGLGSAPAPGGRTPSASRSWKAPTYLHNVGVAAPASG